MIIVISIIAIVALVSLYDYFSAKNWQQVTSAVRNDVVFEKRNKAYGAYVIRRDYNKRMILIMAGLVGSMGATYGAYLFTGGNPEMKVAVAVPDDDYDTTVLTLDVEPVIPDLPTERTESLQKIDPNPSYVAEDDPAPPPPDVPSGDNPTGKPQDGTGTTTYPPILPPEPPIVVPPAVIPTGPYEDVDELAEYIGGKPKMMEFLMNNLKYPEIPQMNGIGGKCYLRFVVGKDGGISHIRVTRGLDDCPECEQEAIRVIRKMPKWRPGKVNGKPVDSYFDMPINFVVE